MKKILVNSLLTFVVAASILVPSLVIAGGATVSDGETNQEKGSIWHFALLWSQPALQIILPEDMVAKLYPNNEKAPDTVEEDTSKDSTDGKGHGIVAGSIEPKLTYEVNGDTVKFTFVVKNQTEREQTLTFTSSQRFDYTLSKDGEVIKQFSADKSFLLATQEVKLKQAEELQMEDIVDGLDAGNYKIEFWLTEKNLPNARATVEFKIEEGAEGVADVNFAATADAIVSGNSATVKFLVKNISNDGQTLKFTSSQRFDYALFKDGEKIKHYSADKMFLQALEEEAFLPGRELAMSDVIDGLEPGNYKIDFWLTHKGDATITASKEFTVK